MRPFGSFWGICRTWPSVSFVIFSTSLLLGHPRIENFSDHYFRVKRRCVREDVEGTRIRVGIPTRFSLFGHNSSLQPCFVVEVQAICIMRSKMVAQKMLSARKQTENNQFRMAPSDHMYNNLNWKDIKGERIVISYLGMIVWLVL